MIAVILAGGQGTRLWPMSRKHCPKQFFPLISEKAMILEVYERLKRCFDDDKIYISTLPEFADAVRRFIPEIDDDHLIIEPSKRDNGPAQGYVCHQLALKGLGDETMVFIPTDHLIQNSERFLRILSVGDQMIQKTGKMCDIGVVPEFANPLLGYTKIGDKVEVVDETEVYAFLGHTEKPDKETAKAYIESGNYLWHANYYMWTPNLFMDAYKQYAPDIFEKLRAMRKNPEKSEEIYQSMPAISIDYAITEKMNPDQVLILKGDFGWSDVGNWNILHDQLVEQQKQKNIFRGEVLPIDTDNCLVYGDENKLIATVGLQDHIVVDTKNALLICPKERAGEVKYIVEKLKIQELDQYL